MSYAALAAHFWLAVILLCIFGCLYALVAERWIALAGQAVVILIAMRCLVDLADEDE